MKGDAKETAPGAKAKDPPAADKKSEMESGNRLPHSKARPIVRFHTSTSPFTVERDLRVKITTKSKAKGPVRPGDELEVTVTTTDPQGKPVAAELSLAMIEQSLLERFASPLPSIGDFFRGAQREPAVRCTSSITFNYRPATQPINPRLLAEKDREEIAKEEAESRRVAIAAASTPIHAATVEPATPADMAGLTPQIMVQEEESDRTDLGEESSTEATVVNNGAVLSLGSNLAPGNQAMGRNNNLSRSGAGQLAMGRNFNRQRGLNQPQSGMSQQAAQEVGFVNSAALYGFATHDHGNPTDGHFFIGSNVEYGNLAANGTFTTDLNTPFPQGNYALVLNGGNSYTGGTTITGGDLNSLVAQNQKQLLCVDNSGMFRTVRLGHDGKLDDKQAAAMAAEFNASGAILLSSLLPQETGYWNPVVTTGADGKATITLTVPERSTAWKFLAKGLSTETLAGEASDDLTVKKDLFGEIKLPLAFTDGDTAEIPVTVHNDAVDKGPIEVVLADHDRRTPRGRDEDDQRDGQGTARGEFQDGVEAAGGQPGA